MIRTNIALREATERGIPVIKFDKHSVGAVDYMSLSEEVIIDCRKLFLDDFYQEAENFMANMSSKLKAQAFSLLAPEAKNI